jgi:pSer/pThr/pTyr-binding forkhead associated (FHA) protein
MVKRTPAIVVQLIHISGPLKGQIQEFSEPAIAIGRHSSCHLQFPLDLTIISRKHAEIVREGNQFKLVDLSSNGTFVNGKRVKEAFLKNGDVLALSEKGPKISFLTQIKEEQEDLENPAPPLAAETEPFQAKPEYKPQPPVKEKVAPPFPSPQPEVLVHPTKVSLIIQYGPTIRFYKELPITLGKSPKNDFTINHPAVLDQHAQIFYSQNQYGIKDLTGRSLVSVNQVPLLLLVLLQPDDEVSLTPEGPVFRFLGDGRLLEVEVPPDKGPSEVLSEKDQKTGKKTSEGKEDKRRPSVFKKFFP